MLRIKLVKSTIGSVPRNRRTVVALGLRKTGRTVYQQDSPSIRGMIHNVQHLLEVDEVDSIPKVERKAKPMAVKAEPKPAKAPAAKKPAAKRAPAPKKAAAKKAAPKKAAPKKTAAKKATAKKAAPKKTEAKRPAEKKLKMAEIGKKPTTKKSSAKRPTTKTKDS